MLRWLTLGMLVLLGPATTFAQHIASPPLKGADLLTALRGGGYIIYFRHADTDQTQNDQRMTSVDDCTTQRNLTDRGRDHSKAIGEAIRALAIPIGAVLASPLCRTVETAMLAFGSASKEPAMREVRSAPGQPGRFAALRALLSTQVARGANTVVVGHSIPYQALVGGPHLSEGEADVLRPRGADFEVVARVSLAQWRTLAEAGR